MSDGRRVYPDEGTDHMPLAEGDYGFAAGHWQLRPPGQHAGTIPEHEVEEHDDGTITVSPSIVLHNEDGSDAWHGYLERGVWRQV